MIVPSSVGNLPDASALHEMAGSLSTLEDTLSFLVQHSQTDFEVPSSPLVVLSTVAVVTASDMIPFVPCQPLAISLGAKYGLWAFPICVVGQTLAGIFAFTASRRLSDSKEVRAALESLGEEGAKAFLKFKKEQSVLDGKTVFWGLLGLRLAPFFPFSAGNYLLGGATTVGLEPFVLATILGCVASNAASVLVGMGGAEWISSITI